MLEPIFFLAVFSLLLHQSLSATILVDGISVWKNPIVHVGDSVIFRHKNGYDLYIFRSKDAFNVCNFAQATVLTKPNFTSYTWHPSRTGFYYFSFTNGSLNTCPEPSQKLSVEVRVSSANPPAAAPPAPPPTQPTTSPGPISGGGMVSSSPSYPWPEGPHEGSYHSPGPSPAQSTTVTVPGKGGVPFINSNPAVPLPTGEIDSATINPLPTSANAHQAVVGFPTDPMALFCLALLLL